MGHIPHHLYIKKKKKGRNNMLEKLRTHFTHFSEIRNLVRNTWSEIRNFHTNQGKSPPYTIHFNQPDHSMDDIQISAIESMPINHTPQS